MSLPEELYPSSKVQIALATTWSLAGLITVIGQEGTWSLQTVLLSKNSSNFSEYSLHLTYLEYEIFVGMPYFIALFPIMLSGWITDVCGLPISALGLSIISVFGVSVRAIGALPDLMKHLPAVICLVIGEIIFNVGYFGVLVMRNYVSVSYFSFKKRSFASGLIHAFGRVGALSVNIFLPRFALDYGVASAFFLMAALTLLLFIPPIVTCVLSKASDTFNKCEDSNRDLNMSLSINVRSFYDVVRSFKPQFWIMLLTMSCMRSCSNMMVSNNTALQRKLFGTHLIQATDNVVMYCVADILSSILFGITVSYSGQHLLFGLIGGVAELSAVMILVMQVSSPMMAYPLIGISQGALVACFFPKIRDYVPTKYIGFAISVVIACSCAFTGGLDVISGIVLTEGFQEGTLTEWKNCLFIVASLCALIVIWTIIILLWDFTETEKEKLINIKDERTKLVTQGK